ncbi:inositol-tetrakisphosphate 1-kinase 6-like isoform X2 [Macadamia integrifolia]|uniref:inositol-tetrakisphosphate 1-kinase 6-like isoform X2 n=1 Tax=Macadamia integrifolia TaxID=60698 RepID=UPI001C4E7A9F|nr:inositol-tetrakisphosphate 1-kinase 6-like isoform X2 [Macadamia integrifolia]
MVTIRGILLNELILFAEDEEGNVGFQSGAEALLRRLKYSDLRVGICYAAGVSTQKMTFLKSTATLYLLDFFIWDASSVDDAINEIMLSWCDMGGSCFYISTCEDEDFTLKISNHGWLPVVKRTEGDNTAENSKLLHIHKLEELPLTICCFNRKGTGSSVVTVGYMMKPSREEDFAKRGAFPMYPTQNGLIFVPLTFDLPLESQLQEVDVVLHKATDEILTIELNSSSEFSNKISYSKGMQELERYIRHNPECCVIDPLNNIYPMLDRLRIEEILLGLEDLNREGQCRIRAPRFIKVDNFKEANLGGRLSEAELLLPSIVKPQVACGVADAHSMAITFRIEDFEDLSVPLPAVIQEVYT